MNVSFTSYQKKKNSDARPAEYAVTLNCQLKTSASTLNPVLVIRSGDWRVSYNYANIPDWGRWYFVSDVTYLTGERVEVALTCDYLGTWRSYIGNYTAFVERTSDSNYYNTAVEDEYLSNSTSISNSQIARTALSGGFDRAVGFYILRTVCNVASSTGIASYVLTLAQLTSVLSFIFTDDNFADVLSDATVKTFFNPFQYIVDIKWIPFDYSTYTGVLLNKSSVKFGWWDSGVEGYLMGGGADGVLFYANSIALPENSYSDWRRYSDRMSSYNLYLPAVGTVQLSANETWEGLCCLYELDLVRGECLVSLYSGRLTDDRTPTGALIATYKTTLSVPIQIGQINSSVTSTVGSLGTYASSILRPNLLTTIAAALTSMHTALSPTPSINGTTGERFTLYQHPDIEVSINNLASCEYPSNVAGRPCYKNIQLSNLSGFVKCGAASVPLDGYDADTDAVNTMLNNGFYRE